MENQNLSHFSMLFRTERTRASSSSQSQRNPYQVDYDRILFSSAFRRLQEKTQVFPFPQRSGIHNRLTHSLEVASIGRSLATTVALHCFSQFKKQLSDQDLFNLWVLPDVISAACLAHDIGNPAFGHAGEDAIRSFFQSYLSNSDMELTEAERCDLLYFEGNANAIRLLTRHFQGKAVGGFGLTYTTLAALIKYPWESIAIIQNQKFPSKFGFFQSEKELTTKIFSAHSLDPLIQTPYLLFSRHPFVYLVEAADDISYLLIDLEDAFKLQIISYKEALHYFRIILNCFNRDFKSRREVTDPNERLAIARSQCLGILIENLGNTFFDFFLMGNGLSELLYKNKDQFHNEPLKPFSLVRLYQQTNSQFQKAWDELKRFSIERIYTHEAVIKLQLTGYEVLHGILERFIPALLTPLSKRTHQERQICSLIPRQFQVSDEATPYEKIMAFLDFLSGMTDAYALRLYRHLTGIELPIMGYFT